MPYRHCGSRGRARRKQGRTINGGAPPDRRGFCGMGDEAPKVRLGPRQKWRREQKATAFWPPRFFLWSMPSGVQPDLAEGPYSPRAKLAPGPTPWDTALRGSFSCLLRSSGTLRSELSAARSLLFASSTPDSPRRLSVSPRLRLLPLGSPASAPHHEFFSWARLWFTACSISGRTSTSGFRERRLFKE